MGGGGAWLWFTAVARKRGARAREERVLQGGFIENLAIWVLRNCSSCAEEQSCNRCSGRAGASEVAGQQQCCVAIIRRATLSAHQSRHAGSFKILLSSSRLETRTKESCSMKSIMVANHDAQ
jgi:hypothetical protein